MREDKPKVKRILINKIMGVKPLTIEEMEADGYTEECIEEVTNNRGEIPDGNVYEQ